jgi:hypothetical protein
MDEEIDAVINTSITIKERDVTKISIGEQTKVLRCKSILITLSMSSVHNLVVFFSVQQIFGA